MDFRFPLFILAFAMTMIVSAESTTQAVSMTNPGAATCNTPSPYYQEAGDAYFDLETDFKFEPAEEKRLKEMYQYLAGDWQGTLIESQCKGSDKNPRRVSRTAEVKVTAKEGIFNNMVIRTEKHYPKERITKSDHYDLFDERHIFDFRFNEQEIETTQKYRRRIIGVGGVYGSKPAGISRKSNLVERVFNIRTTSRGYTLAMTVYTNGYLTDHEVFTLHK